MTKRKLREPLEDRKGTLYFDGFSTIDLAKKYDTPLYLLSEKRIRDNYDRLYGALVNSYKYVRIYYAAKANTNLEVLRILESQGSYLDTVSPGEVFLALSSGFTPDRIMFTGTSVRNDELKMLADANITINID
jgi:diaminopimelate decarboxylase